MSTVARSPATPLTETLSRVAADYQTADVIPHCPSCSRPCCKLDALVLELEWKQVKPLWQIEASRKDFDRQLAAGKGPVEIRAANGLYYIHSKPCPAYDETAGNCRVYGQDIKPPGCSDFPVYEDEGDLIVDLRSLTMGVGTFDWGFDHLQELQGRQADEVVQTYGAGAAEAAQ